MMMKKMLWLILGVALAATVCSAHVLADSDIAVKINDEPVLFSQPPMMQNDRILVPIRALAETMKFDVDWDGNGQIVTISDMSKTLKLRIGVDVVNKTYKYRRIQEENIKIDVPAAIYEDYTYVPLRAVAELFGAEVVWKQENQTAEIKYLNTYGKVITFEDEGIEKWCRVEVTMGYPDSYYDIQNDAYLAAFHGELPLYDGPIYEGMAQQIKQIGFNCTTDCPEWLHVRTLNDMKYLPNVTSIMLRSPELKDISGLKYNKTYDEIDFSFTPIDNVDVLNGINVKEHIQFGYEFNDKFHFGLHYGLNSDGSIYSTPEAKDYQTWAKRCSELYHKINSVCQEIISDNMSDYEKAKSIHDWILDNTEYDYESADATRYGGNSAPHAGDFCGVFLDGKAVCEGYAETFEFLCNMAGLECICISGEADGPHGWESHGWNLVKIDGNYYHVDTTWDDTGGGATDEYFLKSDEFMRRNHSWETEWIVHDWMGNPTTETGGYPICPKSYGE